MSTPDLADAALLYAAINKVRRADVDGMRNLLSKFLSEVPVSTPHQLEMRKSKWLTRCENAIEAPGRPFDEWDTPRLGLALLWSAVSAVESGSDADIREARELFSVYAQTLFTGAYETD